MVTASAKLIVIRGPSGAGKSTIARAVVDGCDRPAALVQRDAFMLMFNDPGRFSIDQDLIEAVIRGCLDRGVSVVFEGNFKVETHRQLLDRLFSAHPAENYVVYLDVSLAETLRRHGTRPQTITVDKMIELYPTTTPLGFDGEVLIPENASVQETVADILRMSGLQADIGRRA